MTFRPGAGLLRIDATYLDTSNVAADRAKVDRLGAIHVMRSAGNSLRDIDGERFGVTRLRESRSDWMNETCHKGNGER